MIKQVFIDLESTGTNPETNGIHQISGIIVIDGKTEDEFDFKVRPQIGTVIDPKALEIGGVTADEIGKYAEPGLVHRQLIKLLSRYVDKFKSYDKFHFCGYNSAYFDMPFLRKFFTRNGDNYFGSFFWSASIDVMILAAEHLKAIRHVMPDFKLSTVAAQLGITVNDGMLHDGLYDVRLTKQVYDFITKKETVTV